MFFLRTWLQASRDAVDTIGGLLAADDDLLCSCRSDHVCLDCELEVGDLDAPHPAFGLLAS